MGRRAPQGLAEQASLLEGFRDFAPPGADGHRARMRERLLKAGPDALADHEMLEMLLFLALPRRDTKAIARALLSRFRSFSRCHRSTARRPAGDRGAGGGRRGGIETGARGGPAAGPGRGGRSADFVELGPADGLSERRDGARAGGAVSSAVPRHAQPAVGR